MPTLLKSQEEKSNVAGIPHERKIKEKDRFM